VNFHFSDIRQQEKKKKNNNILDFSYYSGKAITAEKYKGTYDNYKILYCSNK
jgi:hypothetical protein